VVVSFRHTDGGLVVKPGEPGGFLIAGADRQWRPATVRVEQDRLVMTNPGVAEPVAVRYAWENNPPVTLWNGAGLPASPFRTDDWPSQ
jgi:sialate O-acetylesterase